MALNLVAALVAGGGKREHSLSPNVRVTTGAKYRGKDNPISLTFENGHVFFIVRDAITADEYAAEVMDYPITLLKPQK
jgi:hypothetical protein